MRGLSGTFCLTEEITDSKITTITLNFSHTEEGSTASDNFQSPSAPLLPPTAELSNYANCISQTIRTKHLAELLLLLSTRTPSEQQEIPHLWDLLPSFHWFVTGCQSYPRNGYKQISINTHFQQGLWCYCFLYSVKIRERSTNWTDESGGCCWLINLP